VRAITGAVFGVVGSTIARVWPAWRWRLGAIVFVTAAILAQGLEPFLEVLLYDGRLGYDVEAARWAAFGRAIAAATVAYWGALLLCARPPSLLRAG
jgi:hypothetical protein